MPEPALTTNNYNDGTASFQQFEKDIAQYNEQLLDKQVKEMMDK